MPPSASEGGPQPGAGSRAPERWMALSAVVALLTMALKVLAWRLTGSVGMLSDALESVVNLIAAGFGVVMLRIARTPPDPGHPFGHQKAEYFSSILEGFLVLTAGIAIGWAALHRFLHPAPIVRADVGILISVLASVINGLMAWGLLRASRSHASIASRADALHLLSDVWSTVAVVAGVLGAVATGWLWLDPLAAMLVAGLVLYHGWHIVSDSVNGLMDAAVTAPEHQTIEAAVTRALATYAPLAQLQRLRTRVSGQQRFVDVCLLAPGDWSLARCHACRQAVLTQLGQTSDTILVSIEFLPLEPSP